MEVDTGSTVSIISQYTYSHLRPRPERPLLSNANVRLRTYTGEHIKITGHISVDVSYGQDTYILSFLVVEGNGPSLLGHDWLGRLKPNIFCFLRRIG